MNALCDRRLPALKDRDRALGEDGNAIMWARLSDFSGSGVLAMGCIWGPCIVTILPTDRGFECHFSGGWTRIEEEVSSS
jgi:hypothetical protein